MSLVTDALLFKQQKKYQEAYKKIRLAIELAPNNHGLHLLRKQIEQKLGKEKWEHYFKQENLTNKNPLKNKTVLIYAADWGLGDAFQLMRYARLTKKLGANIILEVALKPLIPLLSLCPYIDTIITPTDSQPYADFYIAMTDMPELCKNMLSLLEMHSPYLQAEKSLEKYWHTIITKNSGFSIGICWEGNTQYHRRRCIPLELLTSLAENTGIHLYSLQVGQCTKDIATLSHKNLIESFNKDFDKSHGCFMDTAAVMKSLDLAITIDTSIAHLAGALGVPVWIMLAKNAEWRWQENPDLSGWAPNYPSMRLFRQAKEGEWAPVIQEIRNCLPSFMEKKRPSGKTLYSMSNPCI